jgi:hypothetical protein
MFGSGSLEDQLRKEGAKTAPATVLSEKDGFQMREGGAYNTGKDITRLHFTVRVEPEDEPAFEAKIVIRRDHMRIGQWGFRRPKVAVLYDPKDHGRVAFDFDAMAAEDGSAARAARLKEVVDAAQAGEPLTSASGPATDDTIDTLQKLGDLRDRGVLTDAEFAAQKAKLLG